ncbi:hypothetical protein, partial [Actinacidiphila rubida]|uniref:hypothetical protein n=1 Tax=Actinacidiphila rubida TaxID=310780 RepID=UPI001C40182A
METLLVPGLARFARPAGLRPRSGSLQLTIARSSVVGTPSFRQRNLRLSAGLQVVCRRRLK